MVLTSLLIHLGYLDSVDRIKKYFFYQGEDRDKILSYENILYDKYNLLNVNDILLSALNVER